MMHDALPVVVTDPFPRDVAPRSVLERACMHWLRDGRDLVHDRGVVDVQQILEPHERRAYPGFRGFRLTGERGEERLDLR